VNHIGVPRAHEGANAPSRREIPVSAHSHRGDRDAGRSETANERCVGCCDDEGFVTLLTLSAGQEIHLALATAPFSAGVQVEYAQRCGNGHIRKDVPRGE
jgi:hypothetical protein